MEASAHASAIEDARSLQSGVLFNLLGQAFRVCLPVLSVVVIRVYGAEAFGVFVLAQLSLQLVFRVGSLGLDRGALWWIARQPESRRGADLAAIYFWTVLTSALLALAVGVPGAALLARWSGDASASGPLRWMAAGLVPMAILEVSLQASMGTGNMALRVLARDVGVPALQLLGALILGLWGYRAFGLELAYLAALSLGALVALVRTRGLIRPAADARWWVLPRELMRYALPIWLSELASAVVARLDVYVIAQLMSARAVGVYAAVTQLANVIRSIRQSFDPVVLALCSRVDPRREAARIAQGLSRATVAILSIQLPMWAAFFCFDRYLLSALGSDFRGGEGALLVLATGWLLNGAVGLHSLVLLGMGRSDLVLYGVGFTLLSQLALLYALTPRFGLTGAACAVAVSYVATNLLQWWQAKRLAGAAAYRLRVHTTLGATLAALAALGACWLLLEATPDLIRRAGSFLAFLAVGVACYAGRWRASAA